jgi:CDP-6-deoxy-D-xylo-4-hexulose-3-dehydrase
MTVLVEAALDGWYTEWKWAAKFRKQLSSKMDQNHAVLTNSGSSATLVAVQGCVERANPNARFILTTACGFPTTVASIYHAGKIPFYVDIIPGTLSPNLEQVHKAIQEHGKDIAGAIFAHTLGFPFEEPVVADILGSKRFLVADACDALGAGWVDPVSGRSRNVGYHADATTLSFFPAHHITTAGEGGAVLTNNSDLADIVSSLVNWGRDCSCLPGQNNTCGKRFCHPNHGDMPEDWDHKYLFSRVGYNLKMTDLQAAMGWSQMSRVEEMNGIRWRNYRYMRDHLDPLWPQIRFVNFDDETFPSPFGFPILVDNASQMIAHLEEKKIGTRRVFGGNILYQPGYRNQMYMRVADLTGSDKVMNDMFWIACGPTLTTDMMNYIIDTIINYFERL